MAAVLCNVPMQRFLRTNRQTTRNAACLVRRFHGSALLSASTSGKYDLSDPYPLPLSPEVLEVAAETQTPVEPVPARLPRLNESVQTLRARLVYQSRKRGTLESTLLLSTFADEHIKSMNEDELKEFDNFMDEFDWDIYFWAIGKKVPPERWAKSPLLDKFKRHAQNEGKVVRRMPDFS